MNPRMLLFDLDGTLLTSECIVSAATAEAILSCKLKDMLIGYITARAKSERNLRLLEGLSCDFIAFYNGAVMYAEGCRVAGYAIPYEQAALLLKRLYDNFPGMKDGFVSVYQEPWSFSTSSGEIWHMETGEKRKCSLSELPDCDVQRIRLEGDILDNVPLQDYMTSEMAYFRSTFGDAVIVHRDANKGTAMRKAAEYFNISPAQIVAFGDDINDMDMIAAAGVGVAMGNAVADLKRIADFITETNDNDGVATWINNYLL